jgi:hypothetical protein
MLDAAARRFSAFTLGEDRLRYEAGGTLFR